MMTIVYAVAVLGGLGLVFGVMLAVAGKLFFVPVDGRIAAVLEALPGANCGGCGYPGCKPFAQALVEGEAPANGCPVGGQELADKLGAMLGIDPGYRRRMAAMVMCQGTVERCRPKFHQFQGIQDCLSASLVADGNKTCHYACLGLGTCTAACAFDAIRIDDRMKIAVVDPDRCTGCAMCIETCPKRVLSLQPAGTPVQILCHAAERGKLVSDNCKVGCVGCELCEKACKFGALAMVNHLPVIDQEQCAGCMMCAEVCPTTAIWGDFDNRKEAVIDREACIGCGICKKICQFEAISGVRRQPHVVTEACTGCGACWEKCPKACIRMRVRRHTRDELDKAVAATVQTAAPAME
ncbi:MAG: RnfABCDGE type electron transport complex subunit B [Clostridia bacterium]|nr:RnfABCDGE type electron transport complex subunit B [Clostridia bacterium]